MSYKQINAAIGVAFSVAVAIGVTLDAMFNPISDPTVIAGRLLWAIGFSILFNIIAVIVVSILAGIAGRKEFKDERADERDVMVAARSMRNAYFVASIGGLVVIIMVAAGADPGLAVYVLFMGLLLAGAADAASRLVYYWIG